MGSMLVARSDSQEQVGGEYTLMSDSECALGNDRVTAKFSAESGNLIYLAAPAVGQDLIASSWCHYHDGETWVTESPLGEDAKTFRVVSVGAAEDAVASVIESDAIRIRRRYSLPPGSPLIVCDLTVEPLTPDASVTHDAMPHVELEDGFNNIFEDEEDLYFDGEELPGGGELPCWRVLFREGHRDGAIVATRSKLQMSHFQFLDRGFSIRPHLMTAYSSSIPLKSRPIEFKDADRYEVRFEIGPWSADRHEEILAAAALGDPVDIGNPPADGAPPCELEGLVLDACDLVAPSDVSEDYATDRWRRVDLPSCRDGRALFASSNTRPPALVVDPELSGVHRVFVGIGHGDGVEIAASDDPLPTYRVKADTSQEETPFTLKLSGRHEAQEIEFGVQRMDGRTLTLGRHPGEFAFSVLDYIRFVPLSDAEAAEWESRQRQEPCIALSGFNDIPDIAYIVDATEQAFESNLRDHARAGVRKVYWRVDGQCSDFPSKTNTMRYPSAKGHGVFTPMSKCYGKFLRKCDALKLAVDAAGKYGLEVYGWMRFNSYMGNVQSGFFRDNPQFHEEWESGVPAGKLCLAFPEVREHKIGILVEAARYGLPGLNLGFLRHPPVLMYAPILVEGYKEEYGVQPPRDPKDRDATCRNKLPPDDEDHVRWQRHRAGFMTLFGRELKEALRENDLERVKISLWVRPRHCLFDGIDIETWLNEGLCDEVVADNYTGAEFPATPEWKAMVQSKALLYRGTSGFQFERARELTLEAIEQGYDGVSVYESDQAVLDTRFIEFYHSLRK